MTVTYYWYDHMLLRENGDAAKVQKAIREHDFETFMSLYHKYQNINSEGEDIIFFPNHATMWQYDEILGEDEPIGEVDITTRGGFEMITDSEYECG